MLAANDKFHAAILPVLETAQEKRQRQQEADLREQERKQERISHFRQRSAQPVQTGKVTGIHRLKLENHGEQRQFSHHLSAFHDWLATTEQAPGLRQVLLETVKSYRGHCDFAILQSACHTAMLIYRKQNPALAGVEARRLEELIGRLHGTVFSLAPTETPSSEDSGQSTQSGSAEVSSASEVSDR